MKFLSQNYKRFLKKDIIPIEMNWPERIQLISTIVQAISTVVLAVITIWYAYSTREMSKIMQRDYSLKTTPFLKIERDIDRLFDKTNPNVLQLRFHYSNVGQVPVKYQTGSLSLDGKSINPPKSTSVLFPGQQGTLFSNSYVSNNAIINQGDGFKGSIKVVYWTPNNPNKKHYFSREFELVSGLNTFAHKEEIGEE